MRISTSQIYDSATLNIQRNQTSLYKLQNQLSTGRRVLTPEDDPVAAAQALLVTQSRDVNQQHVTNQGNAKSQLGLVDSQLNSLTDLLQNVRDRIIQAGNSATMTDTDRSAIATELEARLGEMVGIANSQNGSGDYLFSGYKGATVPFAIGSGSSSYAYYGDDGERLLQVSSSRQLAVNVAGSDLFMNAKAGNGTFVTSSSGNSGGGINKGAATIDSGSVRDPQKWAAAVNSADAGQPITISFSVDAAGATTYTISDPVGGTTSPAPYVAGQAIPIVSNGLLAGPVDFGSQAVISGQPKDGDTFSITPSTSQSLFQTVQNVIGLLRTPLGTPTLSGTEFTSKLGAELKNIDQGLDNVSRVVTNVGTRLRELDSLSDTSADLDLQYQSSLSELQDLDWVKAFSDFTLQKTYLEAAQQSFVQVSGLSLFNYI